MIKVNLTNTEYQVFMQLLLRASELSFSDQFTRRISIEVLKQLFLRLSRRQYMLHPKKNAVQFSLLEALCLEKVIPHLPDNPYELAVLNGIEPKIRQLCSQASI